LIPSRGRSGPLETPKKIDDLVTELATTYSMRRETIVSDVASLLLDLLRRGWVEEVKENAV
jgi:hypothetical protein